MSVTVGTSVAVSMAVVGIGLSISLSGPLAPGHSSEGVSGQTGGVVVAVESRVDVVVQDSNSVTVSVVSVGAPLSIVVSTGSVDSALVTVSNSSGPGGGDTAGSNEGISVAVEGIGVSAPLSEVVSTGSIDGALVAVADSSGPGGGDAAGANEGAAVAVEGIGVGHGG